MLADFLKSNELYIYTIALFVILIDSVLLPPPRVASALSIYIMIFTLIANILYNTL
jgi:hypothetical protein